MSGSRVFTWRVSPALLRLFKVASPGQCFVSPTFDAYRCEWCLQIFPNGASDENEGDVILSLILKNQPDDVLSMEIQGTYTFIQGNTSHSFVDKFSNHSASNAVWSISTLTAKQLKRHQTLFFKVDIVMSNVLSKNGAEYQFTSGEEGHQELKEQPTTEDHTDENVNPSIDPV